MQRYRVSHRTLQKSLESLAAEGMLRGGRSAFTVPDLRTPSHSTSRIVVVLFGKSKAMDAGKEVGIIGGTEYLRMIETTCRRYRTGLVVMGTEARYEVMPLLPRPVSHHCQARSAHDCFRGRPRRGKSGRPGLNGVRGENSMSPLEVGRSLMVLAAYSGRQTPRLQSGKAARYADSTSYPTPRRFGTDHASQRISSSGRSGRKLFDIKRHLRPLLVYCRSFVQGNSIFWFFAPLNSRFGLRPDDFTSRKDIFSMARYTARRNETQRGALFDRYCVADLKKIAGRMQIRKPPSRKAELVEVLLAHAKRPGIFGLCSDMENRALAEAAHDPLGELHLQQFISKYGASPYGKPVDGYNRDLSILDLFIVDGRIPGDVLERLRTTFPPPRTDTLSSCDQLSDSITFQEKAGYNKIRTYSAALTVKPTEQAAAENLISMLLLIDGGRIHVSARTRRPSNASIRLISKQLAGGDWYGDGCYGGIQSFAWPLIVQAAGLASLSGSSLGLTAKGRKVLNRQVNTTRALRSAWNRWIAQALIDEFSRVESVKGQFSRGRVMTAAKGRREAILDSLRDCPCMQWVDIEEFGRHMRATGDTFEVAHDLWSLYFCERQYGSLGYNGHGGWNILQQRYIQVFLMEYAASLGMIDIAYTSPEEAPCDFYGLWGTDDLEYISRYDGLRFFRINNLGAYVMGMSGNYQPPQGQPRAGPALEILPTLECIATDRSAMRKPDVLYIEKIADRVSEMHWRLSPKKIVRSLEGGETCDTILTFLTESSHRELPPTVSALLNEVRTQIVSFNFKGRACLLECPDPFVIELARSNSRLNETCMVADDRHIVLRNGKEKQFFSLMKDLGYAVPIAGKIV